MYHLSMDGCLEKTVKIRIMKKKNNNSKIYC